MTYIRAINVHALLFSRPSKVDCEYSVGKCQLVILLDLVGLTDSY